MALRTEMVNLLRLKFVEQLYQVHRVRQIAVVQEHSHTVDVRIGVKMIDPRRVKRARAANDPVDFVAFFQQKICEITSVLTSNPGDEGFFHERDNCRAFQRNATEIIMASDTDALQFIVVAPSINPEVKP